MFGNLISIYIYGINAGRICIFKSDSGLALRNMLFIWLVFEPQHEKTCFCHMRTTKAQISLRICLDSIIPVFAIYEISSL